MTAHFAARCFSEESGKGELYVNWTHRIVDTHIHIVPGVDDGSRSLAESAEMILLSIRQGVETFFATPHSFAFEMGQERVLRRFEELKRFAETEGFPVRLLLGCEMQVWPDTVDACVDRLAAGVYPTMAGTRFVLTEFDPYSFAQDDAEYCVGKIRAAGFSPIIAHAERYRFTTPEGARTLRDAGARIQINAYSISRERTAWIRDSANALLSERLVDFIGTDAHRMDHRAPDAAEGIAAFARLYGEAYAEEVCVLNPRRLLIEAAD